MRSELAAARCCALDPADGSIGGADETVLSAQTRQAGERPQAGDRAAAERLILGVLERAPRRSGALAVLAEIRLAEGRLGPAETLLMRLSGLEPGNLWPVNKLALLELGRGNLAEAEAHARMAVRTIPDDAQSFSRASARCRT